VNNDASGLELLGSWMSTRLAQRVTRASALGKLGRSAVAVSLGSAGVAFLAQEAGAHNVCAYQGCDTNNPNCSPCCYNLSVTCGSLTGNYGSCPSGSYDCGYWEYTDNSCNTANHLRRWTDCCGSCSEGSIGDCRGGAPHCCNHKEYPQQGGICSDHIRCRYTFCH
jgi:hypothetical protein